jgi:hypothetical protein
MGDPVKKADNSVPIQYQYVNPPGILPLGKMEITTDPGGVQTRVWSEYKEDKDKKMMILQLRTNYIDPNAPNPTDQRYTKNFFNTNFTDGTATLPGDAGLLKFNKGDIRIAKLDKEFNKPDKGQEPREGSVFPTGKFGDHIAGFGIKLKDGDISISKDKYGNTFYQLNKRVVIAGDKLPFKKDPLYVFVAELSPPVGSKPGKYGLVAFYDTRTVINPEIKANVGRETTSVPTGINSTSWTAGIVIKKGSVGAIGGYTVNNGDGSKIAVSADTIFNFEKLGIASNLGPIQIGVEPMEPKKQLRSDNGGVTLKNLYTLNNNYNIPPFNVTEGKANLLQAINKLPQLKNPLTLV